MRLAPWRPVRVARMGHATVQKRVPVANILKNEKEKAAGRLLEE